MQPSERPFTKLWFDVEKNGYTTIRDVSELETQLWFDVEKNGYTTMSQRNPISCELWFDVEKNGYTTLDAFRSTIESVVV